MQGLSIGITKRALLEDYYPGELAVLFDEYNIVHGRDEDEVVEEVTPFEFFGARGEEIKVGSRR